MKTFNINNHIRVKLNSSGAARFEGYYQRMPVIDKEGYTQMQLSDFMHLFGPEMYPRFDLPFDPTIILEED
jgi:hypothetical protein